MSENMKKRLLAVACAILACVLVVILVVKLMPKGTAATDEPEPTTVHDTVYIDRVDTIIIHDTIEVAPQPAKTARKQNYNLVDEGERIIREGERIMRGGGF